jgi:hypothetical protein
LENCWAGAGLQEPGRTIRATARPDREEKRILIATNESYLSFPTTSMKSLSLIYTSWQFNLIRHGPSFA